MEQPPQDLGLAARVRVGAVDKTKARCAPVVARDRVARRERARRDNEEVVPIGVLDERHRRGSGAVAQRVVQRAHDDVVSDAGGARQRPREALRRIELAAPPRRAFGPRRILDQRDERLTIRTPLEPPLDERRARGLLVAVTAQKAEPQCRAVHGGMALQAKPAMRKRLHTMYHRCVASMAWGLTFDAALTS